MFEAAIANHRFVEVKGEWVSMLHLRHGRRGALTLALGSSPIRWAREMRMKV